MCRFAVTFLLFAFVSGHAFAKTPTAAKETSGHKTASKSEGRSTVDSFLEYFGLRRDSRLDPTMLPDNGYKPSEMAEVWRRPDAQGNPERGIAGADAVLRDQLNKRQQGNHCVKNNERDAEAIAGFIKEQRDLEGDLDAFKLKVADWEAGKDPYKAKSGEKITPPQPVKPDAATKTPADGTKQASADSAPSPSAKTAEAGAPPANTTETGATPPKPDAAPKGPDPEIGKRLAADFQALSKRGFDMEKKLEKAFNEFCDPAQTDDLLKVLSKNQSLRNKAQGMLGPLKGYASSGWGSQGYDGKPPGGGAGTPPGGGGGAPPGGGGQNQDPNSTNASGNAGTPTAAAAGGKKDSNANTPKAQDPKEVKITGIEIDKLIGKQGDDGASKEAMAALAQTAKSNGSGKITSGLGDNFGADQQKFLADYLAKLATSKFSTPAVPAATRRTPAYQNRVVAGRSGNSNNSALSLQKTAVQKKK